MVISNDVLEQQGNASNASRFIPTRDSANLRSPVGRAAKNIIRVQSEFSSR